MTHGSVPHTAVCIPSARKLWPGGPAGAGRYGGRLAGRAVVLIALLVVAVAARPERLRAQEPAAAAKPAEVKPADDVVLVEAEGEGESKEAAIRDALRNALEKGGKTEIFSDTKVENFQLMHDTILARAQGIVKDYQTVEGPRQIVGGTWKVKIKAKVSKSVLAQSWGEVQNVLNQIGRPKILVWINERIDGRLEEQSILETKVEERLLKAGFDLVARTAMEAIRQKELADAAAEDNVGKLQAIAKDFDAHIFIAGTANANQAEQKDIHGVPFAFYNCDAQVKMYYTDSGKLLASEGLPSTRGGAQGSKEYSPQAGKKALDSAGKIVVDHIYAQVMEQWATAISAGGELSLEVEGLKVPAAIRLKKLLTDLKGVEHVNYEMSKGTAKYRINAKFSAQDLAEKVVEDPFDKLFEVSDVKLNRVQAKAVKEKE